MGSDDSGQTAHKPWRRASDERKEMQEARLEMGSENAPEAVEDDNGKNRETVPGGLRGWARDIGELLEKKNTAYGDSFSQCGSFLTLMYPNGVKPDQYRDMLAIVRVFDKLKRIATDRDAMGENPWQDIAGYAILALKAAHDE